MSIRSTRSSRRTGKTPAQFFDQFWPALKLNAVVDGKVYGVPFQNSTPLLYYSVDAFKEAGLDPDKPPATWAEWVDAAKKLTKPGGGRALGPDVPRHLRLLRLDHQRPGHVERRPVLQPRLRRRGLLQRAEHARRADADRTWCNKAKVMPPGVTDANAVHQRLLRRPHRHDDAVDRLAELRPRQHEDSPIKVAFLPRNVRNAAPIGGASLILPKGNTPERQAAAWTLIKWLTSPEIAGEWSRFTGYFAPRKAAYDLPEMKDYWPSTRTRRSPSTSSQYAVPWFDTYNTVAVRKAMEDQVQAVLSGKATPADGDGGRAEGRPTSCCGPMSSRPR